MSWKDFLNGVAEAIGKAWGRKKKEPKPTPEPAPKPIVYPPAPAKVEIDDNKDIFVIDPNIKL